MQVEGGSRSAVGGKERKEGGMGEVSDIPLVATHQSIQHFG